MRLICTVRSTDADRTVRQLARFAMEFPGEWVGISRFGAYPLRIHLPLLGVPSAVMQGEINCEFELVPSDAAAVSTDPRPVAVGMTDRELPVYVNDVDALSCQLCARAYDLPGRRVPLGEVIDKIGAHWREFHTDEAVTDVT